VVHSWFALPAVLLALTPFHSSAKPLPAPVKAQLKQGGFWQKGCPVGLDGLRLLTVRHWGWDGRAHNGQLIVNARAAQPLRRVFRKLYGLHFPIRHMQLDDFYGPKRERPKDVTASFECREAVPSPCTGASEAVTRPLAEAGGTGTWSQHAYGLAVDVNPNENPYVGCGQSRDPTLRKYRNRSRHLKGMVTPRAVQAFASIGWGWGGGWAGNTKDYMHFSSTGG
jgi:D-alanyl-D-alanine carboxypeptidase